MKHRITWIKREEKVSKKSNKAYTSLSLKLSSYGDRYLSGFADKSNAHWVDGMELDDKEITITETEPNDQGKTYLNFSTPKRDDLLEARIEVLEKRMDDMAKWAANIRK